MTNGMKGGTEWAILCPGPSLAQWKDVQADNGSIIAVNGALLHPLGILASWWALLDPEVFRTCCLKEDLAAYVPFVTISTHFNFENGALGHRTWTPEQHAMFKRFSFQASAVQFEFTLLRALDLAATHGAKVIRVYGADFGGRGYFTSGFENNRTQHTEKRWTQEKVLFERAVLNLAHQDVDVIRMRKRQEAGR